MIVELNLLKSNTKSMLKRQNRNKYNKLKFRIGNRIDGKALKHIGKAVPVAHLTLTPEELKKFF